MLQPSVKTDAFGSSGGDGFANFADFDNKVRSNDCFHFLFFYSFSFSFL